MSQKVSEAPHPADENRASPLLIPFPYFYNTVLFYSILNADPKQTRKIKTPQRKNSVSETTPKNQSRRVELFPAKPTDLNEFNFPELDDIKPIASTPETKKKIQTPEQDLNNISESFSSSTPIHSKSVFTFPHNGTPVSEKSKSFDLERRRIKPKSTEKTNLCLGDFIRPIPKKCASKETRRIKPTCLLKDEFVDPVFKTPSDGLDNRVALKAECLKIKDHVAELTPTKKIVPTTEEFVKPMLKEVTFHQFLKVYIEIYVAFIENNLILNIINELYFVISLLLARQVQTNYLELSEELKNTIEFSEEHFYSLHNCVYFAVNVLRQLSDFLHLLDRPTLKLLEINNRIKEFAPEFHGILSELYQSKVDSVKIEIFKGTENVCFIPDTDSRTNFPNPIAFQTFRKQRDIFYEILRTWEVNHLSSGWHFKQLERTIKQLLSLSNEPLNFLHLARLFKFQLLNSCGFVNNIPEVSNILVVSSDGRFFIFFKIKTRR